MTGSLLDIRGLTVDYVTDRGRHTAVDDVSLAVAPGSVTALVGESGSGKSTLGQAVLGLLPNAARVASGSIRLGELELLGLSERRLRALRGARIGLVPQDPTGSLNPVRTVGATATTRRSGAASSSCSSASASTTPRRAPASSRTSCRAV
jgi:peptide/nickel transport system ATP-binding protein